jgi:hypothetical protein
VKTLNFTQEQIIKNLENIEKKAPGKKIGCFLFIIVASSCVSQESGFMDS